MDELQKILRDAFQMSGIPTNSGAEYITTANATDLIEQAFAAGEKSGAGNPNLAVWLSALKVVKSPFVNRGTVMVNKEEFEAISGEEV